MVNGQTIACPRTIALLLAGRDRRPLLLRMLCKSCPFPAFSHRPLLAVIEMGVNIFAVRALWTCGVRVVHCLSPSRRGDPAQDVSLHPHTEQAGKHARLVFETGRPEHLGDLLRGVWCRWTPASLFDLECLRSSLMRYMNMRLPYMPPPLLKAAYRSGQGTSQLEHPVLHE